MTLIRKAVTGGLWSLTDKLVSQLGYLAVTIFIARIIGPESVGLIGMLTIFILLAESVVNNGFSQALIQRSRELTDNDSSTIFYVNLLWGAGIYALFYYCAPFIGGFYKQPLLVDVSRALFLIILINSLAVVARAKLTIDIDFKSQAIVSVFSTIFSSIIGIYLTLNSYDYWALVWLMISRACFNTLGLWFFCKWMPKFIFSAASFKLLFGFGSNLMLAGIIATFVNNLYVILIGRYFSAAHVGYFTQASNLSNYLSGFIGSTLQSVTYPIMTSIKEDRKRLVSIYTKLISITMLVSFPLLVGFAAVSKDFVLLFLGEEWLSTVPILIALCFARAITPISSINMNILNAIGRSDLFLRVDLSKLPLTLGALFIALPYGVEGVAWAMVCTSFLSFFINAYYPWKLFGFGALRQLAAAKNYIIGSVVMYFSVQLLSVDLLVAGLFLKVVLGFIVYFISLLLLGDTFLISTLRAVFKGRLYF